MFCRNCGKEQVGIPEICTNCGAKPLTANAFCSNCGAPTTPLTEICMKCGARVAKSSTSTAAVPAGDVSAKSRTIALLLSIFLGQVGAHRFYLGKIGTAVVMLILTIVGYATIVLIFGFIPLAVVWVWNLIDLIMIIAGSMKDKEGKPVHTW
jgi:TM2 domain-containing membrane protein YozV